MSPTPIKREIVPSIKRKTISQFFISALTLFAHFDNMMLLIGGVGIWFCGIFVLTLQCFRV